MGEVFLARSPDLGQVVVKRILPNLTENTRFLRLFLDSLPPDLAVALDFRHDSWDSPEVQERLDERGIARVGALAGPAGFRYLRLREPPYDERALAAWAERLRPLLTAGVEVYCFFQHEDEPTAPAYAERLLAAV